MNEEVIKKYTVSGEDYSASSGLHFNKIHSFYFEECIEKSVNAGNFGSTFSYLPWWKSDFLVSRFRSD